LPLVFFHLNNCEKRFSQFSNKVPSRS